jgi:hypothetical protein
MKIVAVPLILAFLGNSCQANGQGTLQSVHITFDGPPAVLVGTDIGVTQYFEQGMFFLPLAPANQFGRAGGGGIASSPENGTSYLHASGRDSLVFSFTSGSLFNLDSVDLAEYSTVVPNAVTVQFIGYLPDGSTVTTSRTTDGVIDGTGPILDFQTFDFQGFTGLTRVEIPTTSWSLDNLVVSRNVPEPSSAVLVLVGGLLAFVHRRCCPG